MTSEHLLTKISNLRGRLEEQRGAKKVLQRQLDNISSDLDYHVKNQKLYSDSVLLLQKISKEVQEETVVKISNIVTKACQYIFESKEEFVIKTEIKRNVPNTRFYLKTFKGGEEVLLDPLEEEGGGKVDIIAFALRLASLLLCRPSLEKILVFDEPFKNVSRQNGDTNYRERAAQFMKDICQEYNIQVIMVTHDKEFINVADKLFTFTLDNEGFSSVS